MSLTSDSNCALKASQSELKDIHPGGGGGFACCCGCVVELEGGGVAAMVQSPQLCWSGP